MQVVSGAQAMDARKSPRITKLYDPTDVGGTDRRDRV
jgi:hypothetical protein